MPDWSAVTAAIRAGRSFIVCTHITPDGDAIGSQLGLVRALRALGREAVALADAPPPEKYAFLDRGEITVTEALPAADTVIVLDIAQWRRIGKHAAALKHTGERRLIIDHHPQVPDPAATVAVIDTEFSSTAELVADLLRALELPLTPDITEPLYVGIVTDTGRFSYGNGLARAHRVAADLLTTGLDARAIDDRIYHRSSLSRLKLIGRALERLRTAADGRIAHTFLTQADLAAHGLTPGDFEGFIDVIRTLRDAEIFLIFFEVADGRIKGSVRSRGAVAVARLAEKLGGGGHEFAAGFACSGTVADCQARAVALAEGLLAGK